MIVNRFEFIGSKSDSQAGGSGYSASNYGGNSSGGFDGYGSQQNTGAPQQAAPVQSGIPEGFEAIDDDDIPF